MTRIPLGNAVGDIESVTVTELKERTREVIDRIGNHNPVATLRHKTPAAVLISAADYAQFMRLKSERLDILAQRYDEMVARMQTIESASWQGPTARVRAVSVGSCLMRLTPLFTTRTPRRSRCWQPIRD